MRPLQNRPILNCPLFGSLAARNQTTRISNTSKPARSPPTLAGALPRSPLRTNRHSSPNRAIITLDESVPLILDVSVSQMEVVTVLDVDDGLYRGVIHLRTCRSFLYQDFPSLFSVSSISLGSPKRWIPSPPHPPGRALQLLRFDNQVFRHPAPRVHS